MKSIESLDSVTAAGILARTALSLAYAGDPIPGPNKVFNENEEKQIRSAIVTEARQALGSRPMTMSEGAIERIADFLDSGIRQATWTD